jgi:hypothetical protein
VRGKNTPLCISPANGIPRPSNGFHHGMWPWEPVHGGQVAQGLGVESGVGVDEGEARQPLVDVRGQTGVEDQGAG